MDYQPHDTNQVSACVGIDTDKKLKKRNLEAEKRLKKAEQDYLHTNQKHAETRSQWESLHDERRRAISQCYLAAEFITRCNKLVEQLHKALAELLTTQETIDHHSLQFSSSKSLAQENQQKAQCQKLDSEAISHFRDISRELNWIPRKMPRSDSRKAVNDLLKEVKEKNKYRDKALSNYTLVCNPTGHESLRKSVELEIKALKKLIKELQKDWEEKLHIKQYATDTYNDFKKKVKRLEETKEHVSGKWDEENKYMLRTGRYPEAEYIK